MLELNGSELADVAAVETEKPIKCGTFGASGAASFAEAQCTQAQSHTGHMAENCLLICPIYVQPLDIFQDHARVGSQTFTIAHEATNPSQQGPAPRESKGRLQTWGPVAWTTGTPFN